MPEGALGARQGGPSQLPGPVQFGAELVTPAPDPFGEMVQRVFLGIADGPMNLMGQRTDRFRRVSGADLGGGK